MKYFLISCSFVVFVNPAHGLVHKEVVRAQFSFVGAFVDARKLRIFEDLLKLNSTLGIF